MKYLDVEDMAWTFGNFYPEFTEKMYHTTNWDTEWDPEFLKCMKALAIVAKYGFGDCYSLDDFMEEVRAGMFTPYDGDGYFYDGEGNQVGNVWDSYIPENAEFVLWFNK